ncbi:MAG: flotillin [Planctomycetota bacterium]|jgi:flotillin
MNIFLLPFAIADGEGNSDLALVIGSIATVLLIAGFFLILARRYKRCPSDKVLVVYGKTGSSQSAIPIHGGAKFIIPLLQDYAFLSLEPMQIDTPLEGALSIENIRVAVPSVFTVAIGTEESVMNNAAVRLLSLNRAQIMKQAEEIIFGQLRQVIASMKIDEINRDRDVFLSRIQSNLEPELAKLGLILINVNIKDITDESGFIEAIGRKAASEAINQAEIDVAHQERLGAIGVAEADKEKSIQVAEFHKTRDLGTATAERERAVGIADLEKERITGEKAAAFAQESNVRDSEREMRIRVASANATAVEGENEARAAIAMTNASLKIQEADAFQRGETRKREADAAVLEAQYIAQAKAAEAEGKKIEAEKRAHLESSARAAKAQTIVDAEAEAQRMRILAEGEAAANFARLEAEAKGQYEILAKKGQGLRQIVESCGGSDQAFRMLMLEHIDHIAETAASAIANIKFDKIVVWDGAGGGGDGEGGGTSRFLRNLASSLPPALTMMKDIGGVEMPEFFGRLLENQKSEDPTAEESAPAEVKATPADTDEAAAEDSPVVRTKPKRKPRSN